ncbi:hypothetical protein FS749_006992 [Ceratobasidium sp. UAMH 11750]|nr:hypothetical protein FS749_006992 [Ceratobasidium sp. UAMH 11750]
MRYFVLSQHGGIAYLAALRILEQDSPTDVCTFLVPHAEAELWLSDPRLARFRAAKTALIVNGDARSIEDVRRAWHVAEMGIDSECSGIEAVIVSDVSTNRRADDADELLPLLKCFPGYPYPQPAFKHVAQSRSSSYARQRTVSLQVHVPRSPSYSLRSPRLILVSPSRSPLKRFRSSAGSREEHLVAWATGKKPGSGTNSSTTVVTGSPGTEPGTPILTDAHSIHSSDSGHPYPHNKLSFSSLFPDEPTSTLGSGGWLDAKRTLVVRPAALMRRRCRGDKAEQGSAVPYRIQEEGTGGWTISKRDVAHFIVERALGEWTTWAGRRVRIAY